MTFDVRARRKDPWRRKVLIPVVLLSAWAPTVNASLRVQQTQQGIERVAWLQGCWSFKGEGREVDEVWLAPKGASMLGVSRTVSDGKLINYELMVIRQGGDRLEFEAHPSNQAAAIFAATNIEGARALFENPQHDFPQRIGYERKGNTLHAFIEGVFVDKDSHKSSSRKLFVYGRVVCDPA